MAFFYGVNFLFAFLFFQHERFDVFYRCAAIAQKLLMEFFEAEGTALFFFQSFPEIINFCIARKIRTQLYLRQGGPFPFAIGFRLLLKSFINH